MNKSNFNEMNNKKDIVCPVCSNSILIYKFKAYDKMYRAYKKKYDFKYYKCPKCGALLLINPLKNKELIKNYPHDYYAYKKPSISQEILKLCKKFRKNKLNLLECLNLSLRTRRRDIFFLNKFKRGIKILDFGCGGGQAIYELRAMGFDAVGTELSKYARDICREAGIKTYEFINQLPKNYFDIIIISQVIEHLNSPNVVLDEMKKILKSDGQIFISTPNAGGLNANIFQENWWCVEPPRHIILYSLKTLKYIANKHRFFIKFYFSYSSPESFYSSWYFFKNKKNKIIYSDIKKNQVILTFLHFPLHIIDLLFKEKGDCISIVFKNN